MNNNILTGVNMKESATITQATEAEKPLNELIRVKDQSALRKLRAISEIHRRDLGDEVATLIDAEYARIFSAPNPLISIADAQAAATAVQE
jgi:hypothetical protein